MARLVLPSRLLASDRILAGFSTRDGGDDATALAAEAGLDPARLFMVAQVHGREVVRVGSGDLPALVRRRRADGLATTEPGLALAVRTADCVPILLADPEGRAVAAAHSGWRGLVAGVIGAAVETVARLSGAAPARLAAAIGPAIDACCFEVGEEVASAIAGAVRTDAVVVRRPGAPRPFVDLREAARLRLEAAGIGRDRIETVGPCTRCSVGLLHSFRREGPRAGRQLAVVGIRAG